MVANKRLASDYSLYISKAVFKVGLHDELGVIGRLDEMNSAVIASAPSANVLVQFTSGCVEPLHSSR